MAIALRASTRGFARRALAADALGRLPVALGGPDTWLPRAVLTAVDYLSEAFAHDDHNRVVHWLHTVKRAPSDAEVVAICDAVCEAGVARYHASRYQADTVRRAVRTQLDSLRSSRLGESRAPTPKDVAGLLVGIVRLADPTLAEHLEATSILSRRIAIRMELDSAQVARTELAALLHDLGHVRTPRLTFSTGLIDSERENIAEHTADAEGLFASIPAFAPLAPIVRAHHERFDGSGGPDGLIRDAIPLEARIIAVADSFHSMTSLVGSRSSTIIQDVLESIERRSCRVFDPAPVGAMLSIFRSRQGMRDAA
jgi:HD-GYP domain-containing protein (c-di-GMP phosphodiesterase class II)